MKFWSSLATVDSVPVMKGYAVVVLAECQAPDGVRSSHAHGEPYSVSRSRNGRGGRASGPTTPAPDQAPESISSSATTGLTAVCQTTAWDPYSAIDRAWANPRLFHRLADETSRDI